MEPAHRSLFRGQLAPGPTCWAFKCSVMSSNSPGLSSHATLRNTRGFARNFPFLLCAQWATAPTAARWAAPNRSRSQSISTHPVSIPPRDSGRLSLRGMGEMPHLMRVNSGSSPFEISTPGLAVELVDPPRLLPVPPPRLSFPLVDPAGLASPCAILAVSPLAAPNLERCQTHSDG